MSSMEPILNVVVEKNCVVAEYRVSYRIGLRTIIEHGNFSPLVFSTSGGMFVV